MRNYTTSLYKAAAVLTVSAGIFFTSCSKQLDIKPEVFVTPDRLYKDEAGATAGLTGVYRQLLELKRSDYYFLGVVGTDEGKTTAFVATWGGYWAHYAGINNYNNLLTPQNQLVEGMWNTLYKGISNANIAIRYIPGASAPGAAKDRLSAEAKFLRAVFYFQLVQFFGPVPLHTEQVKAEADAKGGYPRAATEDVYALIIADLKFAAEHLSNKGPGNVGRANKEAAIALLGKVYLTRKEYQLAQQTLSPLLSSTVVRLLTNYADLFKEENENNAESLFEIQCSNENNNTNNLASTLGGWHIPNTYPGGGGHVVISTDYYNSSFESAADKRKDASVRSRFFNADGQEVDYSWWGDVGKPHVKKYDITAGVSRNGGESSRNLYYLRYADVLLMYAEAQNELGNTSEALTYLNKIRSRAGLVNWENIPGHSPAQSTLRAELLKERMRELGFEGWRWFDLKRTDQLLTQTRAYNAEASSNMTQKHLLLPIPAKEFETNTALKPADQNPGY
ncbi:RagB/SusD family nutrient uptake outer membrane protein [Chitinophaga pendula]|uniref:RagB/SusD family nutrient uptake outer membrane protein n=1 Tax=Chitinophaga TaxID=79328 RepID=UPI000BAEAD8F|nr:MULTISPECIES: RagB/SusD family nutrient uptake outer membrane protein [Chitinophaga]ASZ11066.1 hypothetical protein CK934_08890 [Chitinophaga sp. MD30]UCJ05936.1 RagB/SusD family nutrient uptake outer membrane protein [Chitinophaga pendula]